MQPESGVLLLCSGNFLLGNMLAHICRRRLLSMDGGSVVTLVYLGSSASPLLKWSWPNFTLAHEFLPKDLNFPLPEVQWARKMLQSVFLQERCCGVTTAQCKKCLQGQCQPWAVAAMGGSVVVVQTLQGTRMGTV